MPLKRRHFLFGSLALPAFAAKKSAPAQRPNIVLVIADDLGAYMLGCYGNQEVRTPNIDHLALTGVRFAHHFSTGFEPPSTDAFAAAGYNCGSADSSAKAAGFLDAQAPTKPFFLSVVWPSPFQVTPSQKNLDAYAAVSFEALGWDPPAANATHKEMMSDVPGNLRKYAAAVTTLDEQIAELLAKLQQRGVADDTLVILTGRKGYLLGHHGLWGDAGASNPVNLYEEVVRTPLVWVWPSRFPPQTVRNDVVAPYDLLPSLSELTGVALPAGKGQSYLTLAYGRRLGKKQSWPGVAFGSYQNAEMARDDRYKLILRDQGKGPNEFYDESADPQERTNQYDNPQFVSARDHLVSLLSGWRGRSA
jgi:arylsulfatase A-like enzyme